MTKLFVAYLSATIFFIVADFIWLGFIAKNFYQASLGHIMLERPILWVAALFYLIYPIGLVLFVIEPATDAGSVMRALTLGAVFGAIAYCTYDLSNLATLRGIPVSFALTDIVWGAFASACACGFSTLLVLRFLR
ncbi:MAG: DUF2177 family protein [Beijerinckiaceae bacterium]|nr:DUF2177 family protein [Beijerinckiaceae bacterium]